MRRASKTHPISEDIRSLSDLVRGNSWPLLSLETGELDGLLERIADSRLVLIGEASHGTSEFYSMRARITEELITKKGFQFVAAEADWPDAEKIDHYVRHRTGPLHEFEAFSRFPEWMWRNREVQDFVHWLHEWNQKRLPKMRVGFHGMDLYSLYTSMNSVIHYLESIDQSAAEEARRRYSCLQPWQREPAEYGAATLSGRYETCSEEVVSTLRDLLGKRMEYIQKTEDGEAFFNALQNARVVQNAERYYRIMYFGGTASWNHRDQHMFVTLKALLEYYGENSKGIVWAHNSHLGDASATDKEFRNELNVGELCRKEFGKQAYLIGFGTDHGTVAAASNWGGVMEVKQVRPSLPESYEYVCHQTETPSFLLPLRAGEKNLREALATPRLERAIGVIYLPQTERQSHYFAASLPYQFDEYIWIDETQAVQPLDTSRLQGVPETYPFGV